MTDNEKRSQRVQLAIEIEDAESDLAYARDKACGLARGLQEIASVLIHNAELDPSAADFTADAEVENRLTPTQLARLQDWHAVTGIIGEMKRDRQSLFNLRQRKSKLHQVA